MRQPSNSISASVSVRAGRVKLSVMPLDTSAVNSRAPLLSRFAKSFVCEDALKLNVGDTVTVKDFANLLRSGAREFTADVSSGIALNFTLPALTDTEAEILLDGCLINNYRRKAENA